MMKQDLHLHLKYKLNIIDVYKHNQGFTYVDDIYENVDFVDEKRF